MTSSLRMLSDEPPPEPPKLRPKPQARGSIGAGKHYADKAAFEADIEALKQEREEHQARMAERRRALDQLRDRSGRQRDGEAETDSQRRVRERHEDEGGVRLDETARFLESRIESYNVHAHSTRLLRCSEVNEGCYSEVI